MEIRILQLLEGAKKARGLTVIIDVFRAFSTACYAVDQGIEVIYPVATVDEALRRKTENPGLLLIGELNEQKPQGFDFGNSPTHLWSSNFEGKYMIHRTSSGTQGILNAKKADEIITGSFVNTGAIVKYIKKTDPGIVSLVCMGYACEYPTDEDTLCAEYIKNELQGQLSDFDLMKQVIRQGSGSRFFNTESQEWAPFTDFDLCLDLNRFDFILKVEKEGEDLILRKIEV